MKVEKSLLDACIFDIEGLRELQESYIRFYSREINRICDLSKELTEKKQTAIKGKTAAQFKEREFSFLIKNYKSFIAEPKSFDEQLKSNILGSLGLTDGNKTND